ncbi:MAG: carbohydrate-binding domain-containing protein, partial [Lachnospiraceae bacterium]|nr:carbohydrate-binding domain-containing protein [Lachnospiraceae bacterium]
MIKKNKIHKFRTLIILGLIAATFSMGACRTTTPTAIIEGIVDTIETSAGVSDENIDESNSETNNIASANASVVSMDVADMFSDRDMENEYEESECTIINLDNESIEGSGAEVTSEGITITEEGEYIVTGTYKNKQITVEAADDAKVRLILKDADIENEKGAAIYVKS